MRIWICAVAKMEEQYIREWLAWNRRIGVDHVVLGDNNDPDGGDLPSLVKDYVDDGFLEVVDKRGVLNVQQPFYREVYKGRRGEFDWMGFIDIDEFIHLPAYGNDIHRFFGDGRLAGYDAVIVSWRYYGDGGHLYYEDRPVQERFTEPLVRKTSGIKFFIRPVEEVSIISIHNPCYGRNADHVRPCDVCFTPLNPMRKRMTDMPVKDGYYRSFYIRHYITRSTEEYIRYKVLRGRCDRRVGDYDIRYSEKFYFCFNRRTKEKVALFRRHAEEIRKACREHIRRYMP